jgi:hypothetical protein
MTGIKCFVRFLFLSVLERMPKHTSYSSTTAVNCDLGIERAAADIGHPGHPSWSALALPHYAVATGLARGMPNTPIRDLVVAEIAVPIASASTPKPGSGRSRAGWRGSLDDLALREHARPVKECALWIPGTFGSALLLVILVMIPSS